VPRLIQPPVYLDFIYEDVKPMVLRFLNALSFASVAK